MKNTEQHWVDNYRTEIREYLLENYDKCWFDYHESYTIFINTDTGELSKKSTPFRYGPQESLSILPTSKPLLCVIGTCGLISVQVKPFTPNQ